MVGVSCANMNVNCEFASQVCGLGCMKACGLINVVRGEQSMHIMYLNLVQNFSIILPSVNSGS